MQVFTSLEENIIRHLAQHVSQHDEISLTALAEECYVSKAAVTKAVKKLGYEGFGDLQHSIRFNVQAQDGILLPRHITTEPTDPLVDRLAQLFMTARGKRNFIFSGDRRTGRVLANYMSRKLALFDIFAPASYDYAFARQVAFPVGFAIFCFHKELPGYRLLGQQTGYGETMMASAQEAGFTIVVITDDASLTTTAQADLVIPITSPELAAEDMYMPKVLMLFEQALEQLSYRLRQESEEILQEAVAKLDMTSSEHAPSSEGQRLQATSARQEEHAH